MIAATALWRPSRTLAQATVRVFQLASALREASGCSHLRSTRSLGTVVHTLAVSAGPTCKVSIRRPPGTTSSHAATTSWSASRIGTAWARSPPAPHSHARGFAFAIAYFQGPRQAAGSRPQCAASGWPRASESECGADGHHRGAAGVDGVDDLGVVDALEV